MTKCDSVGMQQQRRVVKMGQSSNATTGMALGLLVFIMAGSGAGMAMATEYTVGDATGWDFAPTSSFYSDWAAGLKFFPGDKLVFKYLPSAHNVQEVTEADYTACNSLNPIAEYETGDDIITLPKPGSHFYICGFLGHCDQGGMRMKVAIANSSAATPPLPNLLLPSPMVSIIPGNITSLPPQPHAHPSHEHAHPPAAAPSSIPGHSAGHLSRAPAHLQHLAALCCGIAAAMVPLPW